MQRALSIVTILLTLAQWTLAQGGFNPPNPPDPMMYYPVSASLDISRGGQAAVSGCEGWCPLERQTLPENFLVYVVCLLNENYEFRYWTLNGYPYSTDQFASYQVGDSAAVFVAHVEYVAPVIPPFNPPSPADPGIDSTLLVSQLFFTSSPANACTFNHINGVVLREGKTTHISCSPNENYTFLGWQKNGEAYTTQQEFDYVVEVRDALFTAILLYNDPDEKFIDDSGVFNPVNPIDPGVASPEDTLHVDNPPTHPIYAPDSVGYHFVRWNDGNTSNPRQVPDDDYSVYVPIYELNSYRLTASAFHGTATGTGRYTHGSSVTVAATADAHYHFGVWSNGQTDNPLTFTITSDSSLRATCWIDSMMVAVSAVNGTITGGGLKPYGSYTFLEAVPDSGYIFRKWSDGDKNPLRSIQVTHDVLMTAIFRPASDTIPQPVVNHTFAADEVLYVEADDSIAIDTLTLSFDGLTETATALQVEGILEANYVQLALALQTDRWYFLGFPFDVPMYAIYFPHLFVVATYDSETLAQHGRDAWEYLSAPTDVLRAGHGYIIAGDQADTMYITLPGTAFSALQNRLVLSSFSSRKPQHDSWNFLANPCISYFRLEGWANADLTLPVTMWNGRGYDTYRSDIYPDKTIAPFQSFFVQKPSAVDTLVMASAYCNGLMLASPRHVPASESSLITLHLSDSHYSDRTDIVLNNSASPSYVPGVDGYKMLSQDASVQLYTLDNMGVSYAVNECPEQDTIPLGFILNQAAQLTLQADRLDPRYLLFDRETSSLVSLTSPYQFQSASGTFNSRLCLARVQQQETGLEQLATLRVATMRGGLILSGLQGATGIVYSIDGRMLAQVNGDGFYSLPSGICILRVHDVSYKLIIRN